MGRRGGLVVVCHRHRTAVNGVAIAAQICGVVVAVCRPGVAAAPCHHMLLYRGVGLHGQVQLGYRWAGAGRLYGVVIYIVSVVEVFVADGHSGRTPGVGLCAFAHRGFLIVFALHIVNPAQVGGVGDGAARVVRHGHGGRGIGLADGDGGVGRAVAPRVGVGCLAAADAGGKGHVRVHRAHRRAVALDAQLEAARRDGEGGVVVGALVVVVNLHVAAEGVTARLSEVAEGDIVGRTVAVDGVGCAARVGQAVIDATGGVGHLHAAAAAADGRHRQLVGRLDRYLDGFHTVAFPVAQGIIYESALASGVEVYCHHTAANHEPCIAVGQVPCPFAVVTHRHLRFLFVDAKCVFVAQGSAVENIYYKSIAFTACSVDDGFAVAVEGVVAGHAAVVN